jgi:hypothetical protein
MGRGCIVVLLGDSMLCEGVKGIDCTTSTGPKAVPFDWRQRSGWQHALGRDCGSRAEPQDGHIVINFSRANASRNAV